MTFKIMLIGEAAREHAIAEAIARSSYSPKLYSLMTYRNPGIARIAEKTGGGVVIGNFLDPGFVAGKASELGVDMVVIGPEEPQFHGVANAVENHQIPCIGARREVAEIERSKAFMRRLMWKYSIPGRLRFQVFKNVEDAVEYLKEYAESIAIKPARQVGGKGVKVLADLQTYLSSDRCEVKVKHARDIYGKIMRDYVDIDDKILVEERVEGPEYTLQCFTDGYTVLPTPLVQDHKAAFEMGIGQETGGMGTIASSNPTLPFITEEEYLESVRIVEESVKALHRETGVRYRGAISGQMMLTTLWGPTIIEFYSRLGDPEALNIMATMETDVVELFEAIVSGKLSKIKLRFKPLATVVKCIAPEGYPQRRDIAKGHLISVDESSINALGCRVYYGSIHQSDKGLVTMGSRAVEIIAFAETIPEASRICERAVGYVKAIDGWRLFHRSDIGDPEVLARQVEQAETIRNIYKYRATRKLLGLHLDWIPGKGKITIKY